MQLILTEDAQIALERETLRKRKDTIARQEI